MEILFVLGFTTNVNNFFDKILVATDFVLDFTTKSYQLFDQILVVADFVLNFTIKSDPDYRLYDQI